MTAVSVNESVSTHGQQAWGFVMNPEPRADGRITLRKTPRARYTLRIDAESFSKKQKESTRWSRCSVGNDRLLTEL